jgi:hypothetical protein
MKLDFKIRRDFEKTGLPAEQYQAYYAGYLDCLKRFGGNK